MIVQSYKAQIHGEINILEYSDKTEGEIMKKFCEFHTILCMLLILILTTSSGAANAGNGNGVSGEKWYPANSANDPFLNDSTTLKGLAAVPEGFTTADWGKIRPSIERNRYRMQKTDRTGEYKASNHAHGIDATFTREGFQVSSQIEGKAWNWGLRISRYGYGSDLHAATGTEKMITKNNRIEYHRGNMVEWYINDHRGLEQGFTLKSRPTGGSGAELLALEMEATGNLVPGVETEGKGIIWKDTDGNEVLRYSGLYAHDATGKELNSRMAADQEGIRLIVEDHAATYPITIDPFIERKKLLADDGAAQDFFGFSVSISGDLAIVGAYGDNNTGSAYIFSRNHGGADNWGQIKKLTANDGEAEDYFGHSVSISGDTAIVGAHGDDDNGTYAGSTYIFSRDHGGANNWGQVVKLTATHTPPGGSGVAFGWSVSVSGDTAIVGARQEHDNGPYSGSAYIFSRDQGGLNNWGLVKKVTAHDGKAWDYFGTSVSISEDTAIIGAPQEDDYQDIYPGSAYIFSRNQGGVNNWGQVKKLDAIGSSGGDLFGSSVSISQDTAIVGVTGSYPVDTFRVGYKAVDIFSRDQGGTDNWGDIKRLTPSDGHDFGRSVSINGDMAIVGDGGGKNEKSSFIFSRDHGGAENWGKIKKITASDGGAGFGVSVSISGGTVIVGAHGDDGRKGSAYIFSIINGKIMFPIKLKNGKSSVIYLE
jgi:FG-GAP repeat